MSRAISSRLIEQILHVVHPDQTASIAKRWIGTNIAQLQSLVDNGRQYQGIIAQIDFEKAYDNVSRDFIEPRLIRMGFGERFINVVESTYSNQSGRICPNGWIGESNLMGIERSGRRDEGKSGAYELTYPSILHSIVIVSFSVGDTMAQMIIMIKIPSPLAFLSSVALPDRMKRSASSLNGALDQLKTHPYA